MITYEEINNKIQDLAKAVGEHNTYIKNIADSFTERESVIKWHYVCEEGYPSPSTYAQLYLVAFRHEYQTQEGTCVEFGVDRAIVYRTTQRLTNDKSMRSLRNWDPSDVYAWAEWPMYHRTERKASSTTDNERRANRATCIVEQYEPSEPLETNLIDLLTDLRHLASQSEIDFERAVFVSEIHYEAELEENLL